MSPKIICLKDRTNFPDPTELWPQRLFAFELRGRVYAARALSRNLSGVLAPPLFGNREDEMDEHLLRTAVIGLVFAFGMLISSARAEIKTQAIDYKQGDATLEGYLAYDDTSSAKRPGIIVAHEWGGLTPYEKMRSELLAKLGFVAFAAISTERVSDRPTSPTRWRNRENIQTIARFCAPA